MPASSFDAFCRFAFTFLEEQGVRYLVIGGLAVVVVGEPRTTADADAIVFLSVSEAEALIGLAANAGFELQLAVERERLATTGTMRFRRSQFQLDLITASLPFEEAAFRRASRHKLFGVSLPFPSPEDLILLKVLAGRDKDMLDAIGIARRHRDHLDITYLETTIQPICDLAEDQSPWRRLQRVIADGR
ncbi:MAG: nucleotidyltransferase [Planctomycetes bacterium]|nr:nucleotidyltransferase [Planctomycetota bacterium]